MLTSYGSNHSWQQVMRVVQLKKARCCVRCLDLSNKHNVETYDVLFVAVKACTALILAVAVKALYWLES